MKFIKKILSSAELSAFGKRFFLYVVYIVMIFYYLWCIPAIYFLNLDAVWLRYFLAGSFTIAVPAALIIFRKNKISLCYIAGVYLFFGIWFYLIPASHDRNWLSEMARLPSVSFNGDLVTIKNIRSFKYKSETDFIPTYQTRSYNMNDIESVNYILSYWDGNKAIAHTMLSFGFKNGEYLCVSVEARREKGESQGALAGLYKQYELIYILADESDVLLLRTNYRREEVYVYPFKVKVEGNKKKLLLEILKRVDAIDKTPIFYNTIKHNCFTSLLQNASTAFKRPVKLDYRIILNGFSDKMGFERGWFDTNGLDFSAFKKLHHINQYVQNDPEAEKNFSKKIRPWDNQSSPFNE